MTAAKQPSPSDDELREIFNAAPGAFHEGYRALFEAGREAGRAEIRGIAIKETNLARDCRDTTEAQHAALLQLTGDLLTALEPFERAWASGKYGAGLSAHDWKSFSDTLRRLKNR